MLLEALSIDSKRLLKLLGPESCRGQPSIESTPNSIKKRLLSIDGAPGSIKKRLLSIDRVLLEALAN